MKKIKTKLTIVSAVILLNLGLNAQDAQRMLFEATMAGNLEAVESLISQGADPNKKYKGDALYNGTAFPANDFVLNQAIIMGNVNMVKLLLDKGADPNKLDFNPVIKIITTPQPIFDEVKDPNTGKVLQEGDRDIKIIELLIVKKVDLKAKWVGKTVYQHSVGYKRPKITKLLEDNGIKK